MRATCSATSHVSSASLKKRMTTAASTPLWSVCVCVCVWERVCVWVSVCVVLCWWVLGVLLFVFLFFFFFSFFFSWVWLERTSVCGCPFVMCYCHLFLLGLSLSLYFKTSMNELILCSECVDTILTVCCHGFVTSFAWLLWIIRFLTDNFSSTCNAGECFWVLWEGNQGQKPQCACGCITSSLITFSLWELGWSLFCWHAFLLCVHLCVYLLVLFLILFLLFSFSVLLLVLIGVVAWLIQNRKRLVAEESERVSGVHAVFTFLP